MAVIRTENLGKTYRGGTVALRGLNLEVQAGEVFGFLGPNGAGKSTTIQLLLNFIRPGTGAAFLFGRPVTCTEARQKLGYLPESVNLPDYYSGRELLEFHGALLGLTREEASRQAGERLERVGLGEAAGRKISGYSQGMRQRLGLGQALLDEPELLILDEPTSNLDPVARRDFRDILLDLKARGTTVFICSHILSEVESVCDRVAILQQGELKRAGTLEELSESGGSVVRARDLPGAAMEAVVAAGARLTVEGGESTISCADRRVLEEVKEALERFGVEAGMVESRSQSLEEIFFGTIEGQEKE